MLVVAVGFASCNNEWEDEQFAQYVSFKSVPNTLGVTDTYVRYKTAGEVTYELPIIISGSVNNKSVAVQSFISRSCPHSTTHSRQR